MTASAFCLHFSDSSLSGCHLHCACSSHEVVMGSWDKAVSHPEIGELYPTCAVTAGPTLATHPRKERSSTLSRLQPPCWKAITPFGFFKKLFIFNWRIIALQYCDGFCHTSTWIGRRHTYVSCLLSLPSPPHPSRLSQSTSFGIPASYSKFPLAGYFAYGDVYVSTLLSQSVPPLFPPLDF